MTNFSFNFLFLEGAQGPQLQVSEDVPFLKVKKKQPTQAFGILCTLCGDCENCIL